MAKKQNQTKPETKNAKPAPKKLKAAPASCYETNPVTFISAKGKEFIVKNLTKFAARFNLNRTGISRLANGTTQSYKGWTAKLA